MDGRLSHQDIENIGTDRSFGGFPVREIVGFDPINNLLRRIAVDGSGNILTSSMIGASYDYIGVTQTNSTTDTYTFKRDGAGGTTVGTLTLVYTDSNKTDLSSVSKT